MLSEKIYANYLETREESHLTPVSGTPLLCVSLWEARVG